MWSLAADQPDSAPVLILNAGALLPLVKMLSSGVAEARKEASGVLSTLAMNSKETQLAIAIGLAAQIGGGGGGGSSADDAGASDSAAWQFACMPHASGWSSTEGVALTLLWCTVPVQLVFSSCYSPTAAHGTEGFACERDGKDPFQIV